MKWLLNAFLLSLALASPAWAAVIFDDTCTDTNGTAMASHTPDTGTSWTQIYDDGAGQMIINNNTCAVEFVSANDGSLYTANATYSTANYTVTATLGTFGTATTRPIWIACRHVDAGGFDGYYAYIDGSTNANDVRIYRLDNGTGTKLSGAEDTGPTDADVFALECNGTSIGLKKNGSYVINPITDATYSAAGVAVLGTGDIASGVSLSSAGGKQVTRFTVTSIDTRRAVPPILLSLIVDPFKFLLNLLEVSDALAY